MPFMNGVKNFPKDAFIQYWLGKAALAKGDSALAEKSFRQAADSESVRAGCTGGIGANRSSARRHESAGRRG